MFRTPFLLASLVLAAAFAGCGGKALAHCTDLETSPPSAPTAGNNVAVWKTNHGCFAAELYNGKTPITAGNFVNLTKQDFYDGTRFHRVIGPAKMPPDGFMIQDGDPTSKDPAKKSQWGTGGPGYTILDEFPCVNGNVSYSLPAQCGSAGLLYKHDAAGVLSMANTGQPKTGGSQYFITLGKPTNLDGKHSIFGKIIVGLEVVKAIGGVATDAGDRPLDDVVIDKITIVGA